MVLRTPRNSSNYDQALLTISGLLLVKKTLHEEGLLRGCPYIALVHTGRVVVTLDEMAADYIYAPIRRKKRTPKGNRQIGKTRRVIKNIVAVLHQESFQEEVGIKPAEVFLGGSVGQGTAITQHYDLDLVLYSRSISYQSVLEKEDNGRLKKKINAYLSQALSPNYTYLGSTSVTVQFKYRLPEKGYLNVDLMLSPYWESREQYWRDLAQIHPTIQRLRFSVGSVKYQTAYIKEQPQRVHELIRRAKAWRNVTWQNDKPGKPKSYLISLLVITAYNRCSASDQHRVFKHLAQKVGEEITGLVNEIATDDKLDLTIPGTSHSVATSPLRPPCPRIVDPVNPANNVYLSGISGPGDHKWGVFREEIHSFNITITAEKMMKGI